MDLTGALLIAMPGMPDPRFDHAVVLMCAHSPEGAMGLIINKPTPDLSAAMIFDQLDVDTRDTPPSMPVHFGGPVEVGRGFVLHSLDFRSDIATMEIGSDFGVTTTLDVLEAIASGQGPRDVLLTLGYAGWGPGQLEEEISRNGWLTAPGPCPRDLVFAPDSDGKWASALALIGVDPSILSGDAGHA